MNLATYESAEVDSGATEITGNVTLLYFAKETFSAGKLLLKGREIKFSVRGLVRAGEPVTLRGKFTTHAKYGRQFEATEIVYTLPPNPEGLATWLRWYGAFIGAVKAQKLVDEFGMDLPRLLVEDPQQVAIAAAVPLESIHALAEKWTEHAGRVAAASQFAAWGLTQFESEALIARFGSGGAVALVQEDPYAILGRVDGFGWAKVDALAAKVGVTGDDPRRLRGALSAVVSERLGAGNTSTPATVACDMAADKLGGNHELAAKIVETVDAAVEAGRFRRAIDPATGAAWLAAASAWAHEEVIWGVLATARYANPQASDASAELVAAGYGKLSDGKELDAGQLAAVLNAAKHRISVVTGGAGAGKTLVARQITKFFTDGDVRVMLCAPTGKAARRLSEVIGRPAVTIHRLLGWNGRTGRPDYNRDCPLPDGVVIADEASMLDSELSANLLAALGPKSALVLIGDPNQLPPVGAGALLRDILAHDLAPTTRLEHCHRQAGTLKHNCNAILRGTVEPWASDEEPSPWVVSRKVDHPVKLEKLVGEMYSKWLPGWGLDPILDVQFMTAKHAGKWGTSAINAILQRMHQAKLGNVIATAADTSGDVEDDAAAESKKKRPTLYAGDKVIHGRNNYDLDVMNGTIGVVRETTPRLVVEYDGRDVEYPKENEGEVSLAYCLTPHKMQGSEIPCAVVIVPKAHAFMQHRNWTYTAVTRAKRIAVVIGDEDGIRRAAERVENDRRQTLLEVWAEYEGARPLSTQQGGM